ncbi:MAG: biotin-dependent carboxyltransferase family protein [Dehalococcoidia bacterium]
MKVFEVIQPGLLTTVQDRGRYGYQQYGVPVSGVMDGYASTVGNLLVGNNEGAACLEISLLGPCLRVMGDTVIAITGADLSPALNDEPLSMWEGVEARRGDIISFGRPRRGCRSYLAVAGGIDIPEVMGSRSTYVRSGIGGLEGRPLRPGDSLDAGEAGARFLATRLPQEYIPDLRTDNTLRVILGPQDDRFTDRGIETFLSSEYMVTAQANRMGCRLNGPRIEHKGGADILSDGIPAGAVQVPADGLPIIMLADRQTTGGYSKIATVSTVDLPELAQAQLDDSIRFVAITASEGRRLLSEYRETMDRIKKFLPSDYR